MKNHHGVGHFKKRLMIVLLSLFATVVMAGQSYAATDCSTCHGMPPLDSADGSRQPASGAFKGNHQTHVGSSATSAECTKCHGNSGYATDHAASSGNMIQINSNINSSPLIATYSKPAPFAQTATPTLGSCSNVNCHFEKTGGSAPVWGSSPALTDCNSCHATPRGASGSHAKHEAKYACSQCHPDYGTTSFSHATSAGKHKIVVNSFLTYSGGTASSWLPSQAKVFGSCRATACHDTGRNNPRTLEWNTSKADCTACHESSPVTFAHAKHLTGLSANFNRNAVCGDCHAGYVEGTTATADHIDGNVDVTNVLDLNFGYPQNKAKGSSTASCSTSKCHSNGKPVIEYSTVAWNSTSSGCNFCHPNLGGKHTAHIILANLASASYSSTANSSAGTVYAFGCANCHPTATSNHLNGTIDVSLNSTHGGSLKSKNNTASDSTGYTQTTGVSVTCAAAYCHSNGMAVPTFYGNTVDWYEGSYTGDKCARCHGNSPSTGGKTGSAAHTAHVVGIHFDDIYNGVSRKLPQGGGSAVNAAHGKNNRSTTINCNICHAATVATFANDDNSQCSGCHDGTYAAKMNSGSLIADTSMHVNGTADVAFINQKLATKAQVADSAFNGYTAASSGGWSRNSNGMKFKTYTSSYDVTRSTLFAAAAPYTTAAGCLNIACHSGITVKWADAVTCTSCHTRLK